MKNGNTCATTWKTAGRHRKLISWLMKLPNLRKSCEHRRQAMAALLKLLIITLFALSAWWEISLFVSIAGTAMHALQIGTFAACLVAGQLLFADQAAAMWKQGQKALAVAAGAVVVTLMAVSVNGNALYFETQFQATHRHETANDDGYQQIRA